jgi:hypothetical protein
MLILRQVSENLVSSSSNYINNLETEIGMPLERVYLEEKDPDQEEITIFNNIGKNPEWQESSTAGYSYYTTVD